MSHNRREMKKTLWAGLIGTGIGIGAALAHHALRVAPDDLEVTHPRIPVPHLPAAWEGVSVLFLADPHVYTIGKRERLAIELIASLDPVDIVVWGGDFLGHPDLLSPSIAFVQAVHEVLPLGVPIFGINGNAEHKPSPDNLNNLLAYLEASGVQMLINQHIAFTLRGETVTLAGVDDPYYGYADLEAALDGAPSADERFIFLLAHSPQILPQAVRAGVSLVLSGHTHGGQVRVPVFGAIKTQNPLSRRIDCGYFDRKRITKSLGYDLDYDLGGEIALYISRGIGQAMIPRTSIGPRLNCRPEITRMVLTRA
jgi:uncharacterized protein